MSRPPPTRPITCSSDARAWSHTTVRYSSSTGSERGGQERSATAAATMDSPLLWSDPDRQVDRCIALAAGAEAGRIVTARAHGARLGDDVGDRHRRTRRGRGRRHRSDARSIRSEVRSRSRSGRGETTRRRRPVRVVAGSHPACPQPKIPRREALSVLSSRSGRRPLSRPTRRAGRGWPRRRSRPGQVPRPGTPSRGPRRSRSFSSSSGGIDDLVGQHQHPMGRCRCGHPAGAGRLLMNHRLAKNSTITTAHDSRLSTSWERTAGCRYIYQDQNDCRGGDQRQHRNSHILTLEFAVGCR